MAQHVFAINNEQAWGELRNLMPKDYGVTPPVSKAELAKEPEKPTEEQKELTCPKLKRIQELEKALATAKARLANRE